MHSETRLLQNLPPDDDVSDEQVALAMRQLYDHYFSCHDYEKRYPKPNQATFQYLMDQGAGNARRILDFGCGNGRYALALLHTTTAELTGYDISEAALTEFSNHLDNAQFNQRAKLLHGDATVLTNHGRYDLILLLFGVLSHVGGREARINVLCKLRSLIEPGGKLLLTVPSQWRRRPIELFAAALTRWRGRAHGVQAEDGNILFKRRLGGIPHQFFYHLYTLQRLRDELMAAGFHMTLVEAESLLPEWLITQHPWIGWLDARISRVLPASWGYGIRVVAVPQ